MKRGVWAGVVTAVAGLVLVSGVPRVAVGDGDASPRACVDCHKADKKLSAKLAEWVVSVPAPLLEIAKATAPAGMKLKGKHPKVALGKGKAVPKTCLVCHAATSKMAPPLFAMMHRIHETGTNALDCRSCHKLDPVTGRMNLPGADED